WVCRRDIRGWWLPRSYLPRQAGGWDVRLRASPALAATKRSESPAMFITEIFKSIQGEGTRAGLPCIFVRLTGCNLRCTWCDTAYAFHGGTKMSVADV